jgi:hypothetical protein
MRISALESQYPDFHLVSSGAFVTSTGLPLYKIEYDHKDGTLPITTSEIWSLILTKRSSANTIISVTTATYIGSI